MYEQYYKCQVLLYECPDAIEIQEFFNQCSISCAIANNENIAWILDKTTPNLFICGFKNLSYDYDFSILDLAKQYHPNMPIIFVLESANPELAITVLNYGADDYIERPFGYDLLAAKVLAHVRRLEILRPATEYHLGRYLYNAPEKLLIAPSGKRLRLSDIEGTILEMLAMRLGSYVTYRALMDAIYPGENRALDRVSRGSISSAMTYLRRDLKEDPSIKIEGSSRVQGYRLYFSDKEMDTIVAKESEEELS